VPSAVLYKITLTKAGEDGIGLFRFISQLVRIKTHKSFIVVNWETKVLNACAAAAAQIHRPRYYVCANYLFDNPPNLLILNYFLKFNFNSSIYKSNYDLYSISLFIVKLEIFIHGFLFSLYSVVFQTLAFHVSTRIVKYVGSSNLHSKDTYLKCMFVLKVAKLQKVASH